MTSKARSALAGGDTVRVRIDLAYDGTPFAGYARQKDQTTVQGTLEGALSRLLGVDPSLTVAGRTDRGVHADAQVVHLDVDPTAEGSPGRRVRRFLADLEATRDRLQKMLDSAGGAAGVGGAIAVWAVRTVDAEFDARFSATERRYRYRLVDAPVMLPRKRYDVWHVAEPLKVRPMQQAIRQLEGEHDFASFCRKADGKHTVRTVAEGRVARVASGRADAGQIHVRLRGKAFCHQMVRSIVGCLVEVGRGRREPEWLAEVLAAQDRSVAARVAPPQGLTLEGVSYGRRWPAAGPVGR